MSRKEGMRILVNAPTGPADTGEASFQSIKATPSARNG
jgi:hypothetical protein